MTLDALVVSGVAVRQCKLHTTLRKTKKQAKHTTDTREYERCKINGTLSVRQEPTDGTIRSTLRGNAERRNMT